MRHVCFQLHSISVGIWELTDHFGTAKPKELMAVAAVSRTGFLRSIG